MSIFGLAKKGFGMLKKKPSSAKDKFLTKRKVFRGASDRNKMDQDTKKIVKDFNKASERIKKFSTMLKKKD